MPHQCIHCGKLIEAASKEILEGCINCSSRFFFYIKEEKFNMLLAQKEDAEKKSREMTEEQKVIENLSLPEKRKVEEDVRTILKIEDEEEPVILDIESIRVISPGKFEIDLVSLMNKKPIVFKLEEGKYIIDISRLAEEFRYKKE
jgi:predicted  nucleic acid-binding Zn-ribbon protein